MSTWGSIYGSWEAKLSKEQVNELTKVLDEDGFVVEIDGGYAFNDSCGWSFFDNIGKTLSDFAEKHRLAGSYKIKGEEGEADTVFVGTDDQVKRQNYFWHKKKAQEAKNEFDAFSEGVEPGDLARWAIERGES